MEQKYHKILLGQTLLNDQPLNAEGEFVSLWGESFYQIANYDAIPPFFVSLVSSSDHWLFISSTGGLDSRTCKCSSRHSFPYYTEDKLTENSENTGSKTILLV
jgi:hypothetical protein